MTNLLIGPLQFYSRKLKKKKKATLIDIKLNENTATTYSV